MPPYGVGSQKMYQTYEGHPFDSKNPIFSKKLQGMMISFTLN